MKLHRIKAVAAGEVQSAGILNNRALSAVSSSGMKFLLWCILLVLCWPVALAALVLYPIVWLFLLPFRLVGIAVGGALSLVWAIVTLPARLVRAL
jgi:hypothetical protein